jgi:catalase
MSERVTLAATAGAPIDDNQNTITAGRHGPVLLEEYQLIEKLADQNRERIPERTADAKGWGAHGTFTVTHDMIKECERKYHWPLGRRPDNPPVFERSWPLSS